METDDLAKNLFSSFDGATDTKRNSDESECVRKEPMKVYLRIRPFNAKELQQKENQECIKLKSESSVELCAPQDSFTFKSGIRGLTDQTHEFSFSHVFKETTTQKEFFDDTMLPFVKDILDGQNGLVFTYGVTNSGKTYTIQGTPKDGGILPCALDVIFNSISTKLYDRPNLKPKHCHDIISLNKQDELREGVLRNAIINASDKENIDTSVFKSLLNSTTKTNTSVILAGNTTILSDISVIQKSGTNASSEMGIVEEIKQRVADVTTINLSGQGKVKFGVWVSFMEIYNEQMHDLLDLTPLGKGKKRPVLKLGDDKNGNPYVKGLQEVFVTSSDEAYKVVRLGQKNRHIASTKLNQQSSRSHSIFTIKLTKIVDVDEPHVARISRLSIVDLAGSERYCKTNAGMYQLKEASNINCSIMTLGKCISTLRYNQEHPNHPTIVPFRESKLTRLFQSFFLGKGKASMIVNISQCASVFDETYNVMKFSAVAKQIKMKAQRATELWKAPPLPKVAATPSNSRPPLCIITPATTRKRTLEDPSAFSYDELVNIVGELRDKVKKERREKSVMERDIRKEVSQEMNELIVDIENAHNDRMMEQRQNLEDTMDKRLDLLTKTFNKQRKRRKFEEDDDDSCVSSVLVHAEKIKVKERDESILVLQARIAEIESEHDFFKKSRTPEHHSNAIEHLSKDLNEAKETLSVQNESIKQMQQMLQDKDDEIDKLREALDDDEQGNDQEKLMNDLQQLLQATTKELDVARIKLDKRDRRIKELEKVNDTQKADNEELAKLATQHEEWYELIKQKNTFIENEKQELDLQVKKGETLIKELNENIEKISQRLKESEENAKTLLFENDEYSIKLEKYEGLLKDHKVALSDSEAFVEQLNKELSELKVQNDQQVVTKVIAKETVKHEEVKIKEELVKAELKVKEYGEKIVRLEKQMQCYETPISKMKIGFEIVAPEKPIINSMKLLTTPVKKQNNTPTRSTFSPSSKANPQQVIKKLEKLLEETSKSLEKKSATVVTKINRIQQLESQLREYEKKTKLKGVQEENQTLQQLNNDFQSQVKDLQEKNEQLQFQFENQEENCACLENELSVFVTKFEDCQMKLKSALADLAAEQSKNIENTRHHELTLNQLQTTVSKLQTQVASLEKENNSLNILNEDNKNIIQDKKEKQKGLEQLLATNEKLVNELQNKIQEQDDTLERLQSEKEEKQAKAVKLSKQLQDRRKSRAVQQDQLLQTTKGFQERIDNLERENDEVMEEVCHYKNEIAECKLKSSELQMQLKELQNKELNRQPLEEINLSLLKKIENLESNVNKLEFESRMHNSVKTKLEMKLHAMESDLTQRTNMADLDKVEISELNQQMSELSTKYNEQTKEMIELKRFKQKLEIDCEDKFEKITRLDQEKAESQAIISTFQKNNESANKVKEDSLSKELEVLKTEIKRYKTELSLQEESLNEMTDFKNKNIELIEQLEIKDKELKRANEEKKVALDELLKQTVKSKPKSRLNKFASPDTPSDKEDADYITPLKKMKSTEQNTVSLRRSTRRRTTRVEEETSEESQSLPRKDARRYTPTKNSFPIIDLTAEPAKLNITTSSKKKRLLKKERKLFIDSPFVEVLHTVNEVSQEPGVIFEKYFENGDKTK